MVNNLPVVGKPMQFARRVRYHKFACIGSVRHVDGIAIPAGYLIGACLPLNGLRQGTVRDNQLSGLFLG
jgi:hypothetical protein